jgi:YidC/Oxa1 family membrane protein insertase
MQKRLALFLILSAAIFISWQYLTERFYPAPKPDNKQIAQGTSPTPAPSSATPSPAPTVVGGENAGATSAPAAPVTQAEARTIKVKTPFWSGTLSNQGAVLTEFTMTHLPNGQPIDAATGGVNLVSPQQSEQIGAPFRLLIPSDGALEKELNSARYAVEDAPAQEISLARGETKSVTFSYANSGGVTARKTLALNGGGYTFDLKVEVTRNGQPVETFLVIGPSFGDQSIKEYGYYKPAPHASYSVGGGIEQKAATDLSASPQPVDARVRWAAINDNYFAMAVVPPSAVGSIKLINDQRRVNVAGKEEDRAHISVAIPVANGQVNHVYAGPKDIDTLARVSQQFGLGGDDKGNLEYLVSYGWSFITPLVKPIAHFMLTALMFIYQWTHNYGWAIIIFTVALNMLFFPLRWKSSVSMKRAAALQPKMKDLQDRMKKLDKNDPRMADLQKEQVALMREGNPLMGCLPLMLQMPFFWAVFVILTVTVEMRNATFAGWLKDLSSPDPYYLLPVIFVITMIVQQALTPTTADPVQKRVQYLMPLMMGYFFIHAPAGLVLYWMVGNLVGIAQQYVINKITPPVAPAPTNGGSPGKPQKKSKAALAQS